VSNTFQFNCYSSIKTIGVTVLGGLWPLEWEWHSDETNFSFYSFRDHSVHTDMARSTRLLILIKDAGCYIGIRALLY